MRKTVAIQLTAAVSAVLALTAQVPGRLRIDIEFLPDGRCTVSATGQDFRSTLTYAPNHPDQHDTFRCAVPPVPANRPIDLGVTLAPGKRPSGRGAPRLEWAEQDGRWVGRTALPVAPEVVVVDDWNGRRATSDRWLQRGAIAVLVLALATVAFRRFRRNRKLRSL